MSRSRHTRKLVIIMFYKSPEGVNNSISQWENNERFMEQNKQHEQQEEVNMGIYHSAEYEED